MAGVIILSFRVPGEMCKDHMKHKEAKVFFTSVKAQKMNNAWLSSSIENQTLGTFQTVPTVWVAGLQVRSDVTAKQSMGARRIVLWLSLFARHKHEYKTRI